MVCGAGGGGGRGAKRRKGTSRSHTTAEPHDDTIEGAHAASASPLYRRAMLSSRALPACRQHTARRSVLAARCYVPCPGGGCAVRDVCARARVLTESERCVLLLADNRVAMPRNAHTHSLTDNSLLVWHRRIFVRLTTVCFAYNVISTWFHGLSCVVQRDTCDSDPERRLRECERGRGDANAVAATRRRSSFLV